MHWEWKNCPVSWQGQYGRGDKKYPTIMLEAVASQDLWIWHAFYGMAGVNNDINVLDNSPLFNDLLDDLALWFVCGKRSSVCNGSVRLARPPGPMEFTGVSKVSSIIHVATLIRSIVLFKQRQESDRKESTRASGVLQEVGRLIQHLAVHTKSTTLRRIMLLVS
ncbi:ALP1-like protein isoform X1 [Tanacetum coccineum]